MSIATYKLPEGETRDWMVNDNVVVEDRDEPKLSYEGDVLEVIQAQDGRNPEILTVKSDRTGETERVNSAACKLLEPAYRVTTEVRTMASVAEEYPDEFEEYLDDTESYEYDAYLFDRNGEVVARIQSYSDMAGLGGHPGQTLSKEAAERACQDIEKSVALGRTYEYFDRDTWTGAGVLPQRS